ncbi:photosynthetic NDH subunit of subcomplex B 5, chloroplastic [Cucurbita pepo subsp. pepo]|uniref:Photosynthetic NDH subunit of subcomplex B 5, chloroplastic isoform X1 n=1 Tax=Cucurbita maxima TaxID=3661 RepID=A0A6J1IBC3_CUCMA|nr:photosynthetic NDH subunit of subcomplex B 5, chloroplastic isoform X1 [Cucurbita maxima]XP_022974433.1 photosynthetic NDH subunit of subcomplex B 5, chloroplastic isoform X2 [Cucurbita maxima]XP_022974434.1 photosynthetic NDH subunit of subcomplex B 5, chloroplastic isoform X1 [Cucurbita maxima]XP_023540737.1 photosynthetic NDH subunit of subcomplex B 5, chloroplastic [Cucurbita pepo subsp. pepo]XP_023540738.1 photosynthetic NDH subunit of subcomplex B 5, chloroplastic [Cucurbita pepo subsp
MALCSSLPVLSFNPLPKIIFKSSGISATAFSNRSIPGINGISAAKLLGKSARGSRLRRLNAAGLSEIEPDLNEDPVDRWETNSVSAEDFEYGVYDGHHTYFEGEKKGTFWGAIADDIAAVGPPTGFQGFISWLFLPVVAAAMYFNVPGEYIYIGAAVFTIVFCIIEMDKPDQPHNFEPQIYNMERGARDKLISDYNTMDIWEFNEKYGDLWDFTVKNDDITKR